MTDINPKAKPDTRLLLDAASAPGALQTDFSQERLALTNNTTWLSQSPSARTAIAAPREVTLVWDLQAADNGVMLRHGNSTTTGYQVSYSSATGLIECREGATVVVSVAPPGIVAGSDRKYLISWCQHPDGTSVRSELFVYNLSGGTQMAHAARSHTPGAVNTGHTLTIGSGWNGTSPFSGGLDFYFVRIGNRFHSTAEQREDWVALTNPPALTQQRRTAPLVPDRATLNVASEESLVGPALLWSAHTFAQSERRLVGPLVNTRVLDPLLFDHDYDAPNTAWWRPAPDDPAIRMCVNWLWYRPVPLRVNYAHVRVFVRQQNLPGIVTAEVRYRMYSLRGLPVVGEPAGPIEYHRTAQATCPFDHGPSAQGGQWLNLGALELAVDEWGHTWLAIGVSMDETSPHVANTLVQIFAVTVDPYFDPAGNDGLDPSEF